MESIAQGHALPAPIERADDQGDAMLFGQAIPETDLTKVISCLNIS